MKSYKHICTFFLLSGILALALLLRLRGITWGLPHDPYFTLYHPDEFMSLLCLSRMRPALLDLNPRYFVNPTLYYYVAGAFLQLLSLVSDRFVSPFGPGKIPVEQLRCLLLGARSVTVFMGALTVFLIYEAGRKLYDRTAGLLAALFLAVIPLHVVHSHYFTVNVAGAMWVALVLVLAERIWRSGSMWWYLLAGLAIGLATATKYLGLLLIIPVLTAHLLGRGGGRSLKVLLLLVAIAIAFVAGCPYSVLSPGQFGADFYEMMRFNLFPPSLLRLLASLYYGFGLPALILAFLCVVLLLVERKKQDWILLSFLIPFFLLSWYRASHFTRHLLPAVPVLALAVGRGVEIVWRRRPGRAWLTAITLICALAVLYTAFYSWSYLSVMAGEDPRDECGRWIADNIEEGRGVGLFSPPWFFTPPFDTTVYPPVLIFRNMEGLDLHSPECYVITSFEYDWMSHINSGAGMYIRDDFKQELADTKSFMERDLPAAGYKLGAVFSSDVRPPIFGDCGLRIPHDWEYPAPEIKLFLKGNTGG